MLPPSSTSRRGNDMADLYIDMDALRRTRTDLDRMRSLLGEPVAFMAEQAGAVTGIDVLRSSLRAFGDEWDYGIKKLADYSGGVGEALTEIERTFTELDEQLAATFEEEA